MEQLLFVYGSLLKKAQRYSILGKNVVCDEDILSDYWKMPHPYFQIYPTIRPKSGEFVVGKTFKVTNDDLEKLDAYETSAYSKIEVVLKSGRKALAYTDLV